MVSDQDISNAARLLMECGIELVVPGMFSMSDAADAALYVSDNDAFYAKYYGISLELYLTWKKWDGLCTGITTTNKRCKAPGDCCPAAGDFVLGMSDRCKRHKEAPR